MEEGTYNRLQAEKSRLIDAKLKLDKISEFQWLRTSDEREAQVKRQLLVIDSMEMVVDRMESEIKERASQLSEARKQYKDFTHTDLESIMVSDAMNAVDQMQSMPDTTERQ